MSGFLLLSGQSHTSLKSFSGPQIIDYISFNVCSAVRLQARFDWFTSLTSAQGSDRLMFRFHFSLQFGRFGFVLAHK